MMEFICFKNVGIKIPSTNESAESNFPTGNIFCKYYCFGIFIILRILFLFEFAKLLVQVLLKYLFFHLKALHYVKTSLIVPKYLGVKHHSVQFSRSVVSDSLWPHGLQHARLPCPSPTPRACSNSCPSSLVMSSNRLILCHPLLLLPSIFPSVKIFSSESVLPIRWPKYWTNSFSISSSNEYSGLI